ncbi:hypothetical protein F5B20DRAFT_563087 [Whalleya microplaca]|nr:hypothetical protein F5B20DRAFT_563087 [Whalleya microplaca]
MKSATTSPQYWRLEGIKFPPDKEPMVENLRIRNTLLVRDYAGSNKEISPRERFEINLRVILKAYLFFHEFNSLFTFWPVFASSLCKYWGQHVLKELIQTYLTARHEFLRSVQPARTFSRASSDIAQLLDECITRSNGPYIPRPPRLDQQTQLNLQEAFKVKQVEWRTNTDRILALWSGPPLASRISVAPVLSTAHTGPGRIEEPNLERTPGPNTPLNDPVPTTRTPHTKPQFFIKGQAERTHPNFDNPPPASHVSAPPQASANILRIKREIGDTGHWRGANDNSARSSRPSSFSNNQDVRGYNLDGSNEHAPRPSLPGPNDEVVVISDEGSDADGSNGSDASPSSSDSLSASRKRPASFFYDLGPSKRRAATDTASREVGDHASISPDPSCAIAPPVTANQTNTGQSAESDADKAAPAAPLPLVDQARGEMQDSHVEGQPSKTPLNVTSEDFSGQESPARINGSVGTTSIPAESADRVPIHEDQEDTTMADTDKTHEAKETTAEIFTERLTENYMVEKIGKQSSGHLELLENTRDVTSNTSQSPSKSNPPTPSSDRKRQQSENPTLVEEPKHTKDSPEKDFESQMMIKELQRRLHDEQRRTDTIETLLKAIQEQLDHREPSLIEKPPTTPTPKARISRLSVPGHLENLELRDEDIELCMSGIGDEIAKLQKIVLMKLAREEDKGTKSWTKMERLWLTLDRAADEAREVAIADA